MIRIGVYVRVSEFVSWIEAQVSQRVPAFDPRQLEVEITQKNDSFTGTKPAGPRQHL